MAEFLKTEAITDKKIQCNKLLKNTIKQTIFLYDRPIVTQKTLSKLIKTVQTSYY